MENTRIESDSIGSLEIPADAYYGVQTSRGCKNFNITGIRMNDRFIKNIVKIKKAAAIVNGRAGSVAKDTAAAIVKACDEALSGKFDAEVVTDAIQGGAGTTVNMNVNEVIANRATELLGGKKGQYLCHPNDHVNCSQSTNDVIPTAGKMTVIEFAEDLKKSVLALIDSLENKAREFDDVIKMGRTQLEDAVPIRLGQEFEAYASGVKRSLRLLEKAVDEMRTVNIGGTAIGTAINVKKEYLDEIVPELNKETGYGLKQADDLIDATQNPDGFVFVSGTLKTLAVTLSKMCNDLRLLASGPKTGFEEIVLPAKQNGSSIMPGKVNPVIPEVMNQVAYKVIGNDLCVAMSGEAAQMELNAMEPVMAQCCFESADLLMNGFDTLRTLCIDGITANEEKCRRDVHNSIGVVTALNPVIGYKNSTKIAKEALETGKGVYELVLEHNILSKKDLDTILEPENMIKPVKLDIHPNR